MGIYTYSIYGILSKPNLLGYWHPAVFQLKSEQHWNNL